ncbi:MAG: pirin family protein [Prevotella sp.]|nr:pirin family protein [Prevotella sp.]
MKQKKIDFITYPQEAHMVGDGFRVHNLLPYNEGMSQREMDPFLLLDYNAEMTIEPGVPRGVGEHPHRGFSTVTFAYKGSIAHRDSRGNKGVIGEGDVQWMKAARGVLHEEMYEKEFAKKGGQFQMVQLWVNLPASEKMSDPSYQAIAHQDMARYELADGGGIVEVVSGQYKTVTGSAKSVTPVHMMNARLKNGARADFSFPSHFTTLLLVVEGSVEVNGVEVPRDNVLKFKREGEDFEIVATSDNTIVLVLSGEPLNEPIAARGPFVMNSHTEIQQAFADFGNGEFGELQSE